MVKDILKGVSSIRESLEPWLPTVSKTSPIDPPIGLRGAKAPGEILRSGADEISAIGEKIQKVDTNYEKFKKEVARLPESNYKNSILELQQKIEDPLMATDAHKNKKLFIKAVKLELNNELNVEEKDPQKLEMQREIQGVCSAYGFKEGKKLTDREMLAYKEFISEGEENACKAVQRVSKVTKVQNKVKRVFAGRGEL